MGENGMSEYAHLLNLNEVPSIQLTIIAILAIVLTVYIAKKIVSAIFRKIFAVTMSLIGTIIYFVYL